MPHDEPIVTIKGTILDVFAHRFVVETAKGKILADLGKRSQEELNHGEKTFVFMTPRSLAPASVKKITEEVSEAAKWKGVQIIHGPLFYDFMCLCPAIALEFACEIHGVASAGIMTLTDAWQQLSKETNPELTEELAIITRSKEGEELIRRISDNSKSAHVAVQGDSDYEALAFILAALRKDTTIDASNRCLVVETYSKAKEACKLPPSIFVIKNADAHGTRSLSVDNGHHVILSMGDQLSVESGTIELDRPFIWDFATALSKSGKTEDEAERDARECGGSLTIFHRRFPAITALPPKWRDNDDAKILLPLVLIGRWDGDNDHDRRDLEYLTGMGWPDIQTKLRNLIHGVDAPLLTAGSVWTFRSHIDGFEVLSRSLADEHFRRFAEIVRHVFSPSPKMDDKPADEVMFSKTKGYSEQFKDGVAQALLLLAVRGEKYLQRCQLTFPQRAGDTAPRTYHATPSEYVEILMKELTALGDYRQLHQYIQEQLHILIEAAPDPLLETLEQALEGKAEGIPLQLVGDDVNYVVDHMLNAGKASAIIDAVAARAVGAEDYYACDIAPGLIQGAVELAERRGFYAKPFECDIFEKLPFIRPKTLIGVLGLTIGNVETYKNPESVKQRLTEIYRHYARAVTNPNPTIKPSGGLLIGWDANMNIKDIEACYDNPQMADLIRSCPERVADTSKFDYHIVAERVKLNKDEEVCFVSLGLRARMAHLMPCGDGAVPVKADQFVPVLNTDRFSVPLMVDAFKRAGWRPDEKQLWSATERVHYQHCALA
jgi:hypothetical protein